MVISPTRPRSSAAWLWRQGLDAIKPYLEPGSSRTSRVADHRIGLFL